MIHSVPPVPASTTLNKRGGRARHHGSRRHRAFVALPVQPSQATAASGKTDQVIFTAAEMHAKDVMWRQKLESLTRQIGYLRQQQQQQQHQQKPHQQLAVDELKTPLPQSPRDKCRAQLVANWKELMGARRDAVLAEWAKQRPLSVVVGEGTTTREVRGSNPYPELLRDPQVAAAVGSGEEIVFLTALVEACEIWASWYIGRVVASISNAGVRLAPDIEAKLQIPVLSDERVASARDHARQAVAGWFGLLPENSGAVDGDHSCLTELLRRATTYVYMTAQDLVRAWGFCFGRPSFGETTGVREWVLDVMLFCLRVEVSTTSGTDPLVRIGRPGPLVWQHGEALLHHMAPAPTAEYYLGPTDRKETAKPAICFWVSDQNNVRGARLLKMQRFDDGMEMLAVHCLLHGTSQSVLCKGEIVACTAFQPWIQPVEVVPPAQELQQNLEQQAQLTTLPAEDDGLPIVSVPSVPEP